MNCHNRTSVELKRRSCSLGIEQDSHNRTSVELKLNRWCINNVALKS